MTDEKKGVNPLATGVAGAVIGAAAAAAAVVLSNEKNRKKAEEVLDNLEKEGSRIFKEIRKRALEIKERVSQASDEAKSGAKKLTAKKGK
ncbi:hypothetical protein HYU93_03730 [Candidatus Daviesbacteria bacterium]|nr:hypothetical protein [Candidatus Daviesbacteria bacterium]